MKPAEKILAGLARAAAAVLKTGVTLERRLDFRRSAGESEPVPSDPSETVYFVDGYHGGVTFWDWIIVPGGGTWKIYNWPVVAASILERLENCPSLAAAFEIDAHTFSAMAAEMPEAVKSLRQALASGRLELVNGTFAQPLAGVLDGESYIRHFYYGRQVIREVLGVEVQTFAAQEPSFFPQLPQILNSFGYQLVILRTHWAPFGSDPFLAAPLFRWRAPDGSRIRTIPRYPFMHYGSGPPGAGAAEVEKDLKKVAMHYGPDDPACFMGAHLQPEGFSGYDSRGLQHFKKLAGDHRLSYPLLTRFEDFNVLSGAPLKGACRLAASGAARFVTPREYLDLLPAGGESGELLAEKDFSSEQFPCYYPFGLMGDAPLRAAGEAAARLLEAERLDAMAFMKGKGNNGFPVKLAEAWKNLLQAQHHDLHLCSPWHSRRHNLPMGEIALRLAGASTGRARTVTGASFAALTGTRLLEEGEALLVKDGCLVFNSLPFRRCEAVEVPLSGNRGVPSESRLFTVETAGVMQLVRKESGSYLLCILDLPAFAGKTIACERVEVISTENFSPLKVEEGEHISGEFYRARLSPQGELALEGKEKGHSLGGGYLTVFSAGQVHDSRRSNPDLYKVSSGPAADIYLLQGRVGAVNFQEEIIFYRFLPRIEITVTLDCGEGLYFGPCKEDSVPGRAYYMQNEKKLNLNFNFAPAAKILTSGAFLVERRRTADFNACGFAAPDGGTDQGWSLLRPGSFGCRWEADRGLLQAVLAWAPREWLYASDDSIRAGGSRYTGLKGKHTYRCALHYGSLYPEELIRSAASFAEPFLVGAAAQEQQQPGNPAVNNFLPSSSRQPFVTAVFREKDCLYLRLCNYSAAEREFSLPDGSLMVQPVNMDLKEEGEARAGLRLAPGRIQTVQILTKE